MTQRGTMIIMEMIGIKTIVSIWHGVHQEIYQQLTNHLWLSTGMTACLPSLLDSLQLISLQIRMELLTMSTKYSISLMEHLEDGMPLNLWSTNQTSKFSSKSMRQDSINLLNTQLMAIHTMQSSKFSEGIQETRLSSAKQGLLLSLCCLR